MQTPPEPVVMPEVKPEPIAATPPPAATPAMTEAAPAPAPVPATEMVATVKPASPAPEMAAPTVTPPPATAPAPIDPEAEKRAALLAAHPRLKQLETGFQNKLETDALKTYRTAVANLNQSYLTKGIPARRREAQAKGNLAEVTALDAETALIKGGGSVPAEDSADTPAVLVALHQAYRGAEAAFAKTRDEKAAPVYAIYVKALDAYIAELTQTNKIADAQQVKALRDEIATKKPEINAPAPPAAKGSQKALATAPPKPTTSTGNSWRVAAEYLTKYGGFCTVMKNGARIDIRTAADIPVGRFDITELHLDHLSGTFPSPKAADFQAFNGLRDLQRVWVRLPNSTLPDSAYVWLVGNEELNWINFESGGDLTDEVLINLSSAKKLDFLQVNYAPRFTGAGLERMPFAATLTGGNFLGTSFNDDGLRGFASYKKLSFLRITGTKVTDSGFAALAGVKSLTNLDAEQTGFGNEAAAAIATLPSLSTLNLNSTQITDKGLEKLSALKNLTSLSLSNTKVSAEAAGTFQIAHPECRVSR
jgi:hypothetical protein